MSRPTNCVDCHAPLDSDSKFCTKCGTPVISTEDNYCINKNCTRHDEKYVFEPSDLYCDQCGKPTSIGNQILKFL